MINMDLQLAIENSCLGARLPVLAQRLKQHRRLPNLVFYRKRNGAQTALIARLITIRYHASPAIERAVMSYSEAGKGVLGNCSSPEK